MNKSDVKDHKDKDKEKDNKDTDKDKDNGKTIAADNDVSREKTDKDEIKINSSIPSAANTADAVIVVTAATASTEKDVKVKNANLHSPTSPSVVGENADKSKVANGNAGPI